MVALKGKLMSGDPHPVSLPLPTESGQWQPTLQCSWILLPPPPPQSSCKRDVKHDLGEVCPLFQTLGSPPSFACPVWNKQHTVPGLFISGRTRRWHWGAGCILTLLAYPHLHRKRGADGGMCSNIHVVLGIMVEICIPLQALLGLEPTLPVH